MTMTITPKTEAASPTVSISKLYNMTEPGTTFVVNITVSDISDLNLWVINITWDPTVIKVSIGDPNGTKPLLKTKKYNIYEGPFLKTVGGTTFVVFDVDNVNGRMKGLSCGLGGILSTSGTGILATINFTLVNKGSTEIHINGASVTFPGKSALQDSMGEEVPHEDRDGLVTEHGPPPIWTEFWFQAVMVVIIVVIVAVAAYIAKKRRR